ncbi:Secreted RxLR effector peptide protein, partial [Phytophthora palmivora]
RRLRAEHAHKVVKAVVPGNPSKLAADFLSTTKEKAILTKAFQQAMAANGDEAAVKAAIKLAAGAKDAARMSDTEVAKISEMMAATAKKNPKSWPRLRKFAKITLGAGVGALAIYGAYKLLTKDNAAAAAVDTTGSA